MKKIILVLIVLLVMPSISLAARGGNKPPPGVDLETALEETKIELCNLYDFVGAPLPSLCLDFCGDNIQEAFEECDDGNLVDGDGCAADCIIEVVDCGPLSSPAQGSVTYDSTTEGSVATYSCNGGYALDGVGDPVRTCQSDGTWSGTEPTCINPCDPNPCDAGYTCIMNINTPVCTDIDECTQNPCLQGETCTNFEGGYICESNHPPVIFSVEIIPATPTTNDDLDCFASASDPDPGDTLTLFYFWEINGVNYISPFGNILPSQDTNLGDEIVCHVDASDLTDTTTASSATVTIQQPY